MAVNKTYRTKTTIEEVWGSVTCNCCGKSDKVSVNGYIPSGYHRPTFSGGYGSDFPEDLDSFEAVICDACLKSWVDTWKVDPEIKSGLYPRSKATHSETGEEYTIQSQVCWKGEEEPDWMVYETEGSLTEEDNAKMFLIGKYHVWNHYKGKPYQTLGTVWDTEGNIMVLYRALYGESKTYLRPMESWYEEIDDKETFRFEPNLESSYA